MTNTKNNDEQNTPLLDNVPNKGHCISRNRNKWLAVIFYEPDTRPMKSVALGCFEIRLKDVSGIYRAFYVLKTEVGILVFHSFIKKTQKTASKDIETGKVRLKAILKELSNEE